jgi:enoyl-CoA hydratase/carnithine racemase
MAYQEIQYDVSDGIAKITLNRPDKLNAFTETMDRELYAAMLQADQDQHVRVVVLTGSGRGFCAGADMSELGSLASSDWSAINPEQLRRKIIPSRARPGIRDDFQKSYSYFPFVAKPVIGAVNGVAVGLGFVLLLYCDLRVASDRAQFSTTFAGRGLIAEHGISWMLPRLVGIANALDLLYSARMIDAAEALRIGLVNQVVAHERLEQAVGAYATHLATMVSPRSTRIMKRQVYDGLFQTLGEAIDQANEEMLQSFATDDFREGVAHFLEKRPPRFMGS